MVTCASSQDQVLVLLHVPSEVSLVVAPGVLLFQQVHAILQFAKGLLQLEALHLQLVDHLQQMAYESGLKLFFLRCFCPVFC